MAGEELNAKNALGWSLMGGFAEPLAVRTEVGSAGLETLGAQHICILDQLRVETSCEESVGGFNRSQQVLINGGFTILLVSIGPVHPPFVLLCLHFEKMADVNDLVVVTLCRHDCYLVRWTTSLFEKIDEEVSRVVDCGREVIDDL